MLREYDRSLRSLLLLMEVTLCAALFAGLVPYAGDAETPLAPDWQLWAVGLVASMALPLALRALPQDSARFPAVGAQLRALAVAGVLTFGLVAGTAFCLSAPIAPAALLACMGAQLAGVSLLRVGALCGVQHMRRNERNQRNIVVVGTGPRAREFTETVERHAEWGVRIVGYVDEGDVAWSDDLRARHVYKLANFPELMRERVIDEVVVACPRSMLAGLGPVVAGCSAAGVPLTLMNDLFGDYLPPPRTRRIGSHGALSFAPVHHGAARVAIKRGLDVVGGTLGLLVAAPVLALAAAAIRLVSPGPVLSRQIRCGLHGRPFVMYKLRTRSCSDRAGEVLQLSETDSPAFKLRSGRPLGRVARIVESLGIAELPQFWNVLVGDMSLVGPRPALPVEVAQYETWERRRLSMRPGLTCLWQVHDRRGLGVDDWVRLDLEYIDTWSLGMDLRLLCMTIPKALVASSR